MKPERWQEVKKVLAGALEKPPKDRRAYLNLSCPDPDLRREVESLIAAHEQGDSNLMEPPTKDNQLQPGTKLGPYEIVSPIGAGGMGEVYRAHDPKLKRDVAIKVLPPAFVNFPDRLSRFQREARLLASLNHPNIAAIHGFEDSGGPHALVMELVEGPTLADRIAQGPIPIEEALPIAKQIAEGLEYAHEHGVVHRDLKPANIKAVPDGAVKILDFGLAKAMETELPGENVGNSPTLSRTATQEGVLLGTAAYMSPEQAKGRAVDRRADIWGFGCVLYEMLTGKLAFPGESVTEALAAVLKNDPDWSQLPAATPPPVRPLLRRCLQKDAHRRLQAIGDARIAIDDVLSGTSEVIPSPASAVPVRRRALPWALVFLAVAVAGAAVWVLKPSPAPLTRPVTRFTITLPPGQQLAGLNGSSLAISGDGSELAYAATTKGGQPEIYLRALNGLESKPIPGTEGAIEPFFSPDGQWLGFFVGGKLKKISLRGGEAQTLTEMFTPLGATWGNQHTIAFAPYSSVLQQVSDTGGVPQPVTRFENGETMHMWPKFLPGSRAVLFAGYSTSGTTISVQVPGKGERRDLIRGQAMSMPDYAPSGHLIFEQAGNLMAVPLDLGNLQVKGAAVPVVQGVLQYSVSATGTLVYVAGKPQTAESKLVWVSRNGTEQTLDAPPRIYNQPRLSPDGRRVAVDVIESSGRMQVWLYDIARDAFTRFTFEGVNRHSVWTPDGKRIAFMSDREGPTQIFWKLADGSGGLQRLSNFAASTPVDILPIPYSWSPDGKLLSFVKVAPSKVPEFWLLHMGKSAAVAGKDDKAQFLFPSPGADGAPQFSPDGRWLAYASDESGRREIYVQAFPGPGGKWQISTDGGTEPQWNPNGRELFYRNGDKMMTVEISTRPAFAAGKPRQLFEGSYVHTAATYVRANYDVSPNGQRFLMLKDVTRERAPQTQINVVLNWTEELKRLVPPGK